MYILCLIKKTLYLEGCQRYIIRYNFIGQDICFHLELLVVQLSNEDLEKVGWYSHVVATNHLVLDVTLAILGIHLGQIKWPSANVHVFVNLGRAPNIPLQMLPFIAVEASSDLR